MEAQIPARVNAMDPQPRKVHEENADEPRISGQQNIAQDITASFRNAASGVSGLEQI